MQGDRPAAVEVRRTSRKLPAPQDRWRHADGVDAASLRRLAGLVIILICAVSAEVSLRIFNTFVPTFIFYDDSYERYRGRSGESDWGFPLNSLGFKDTEWGDALDDVYRIAGIGDSFAYGVVPYEQVYYTRLEDKLNETHRTEVMNFGIAGIGPADYRDLFMREVLPLEPDMVVVSVYLGNDLDEARVRNGGRTRI